METLARRGAAGVRLLVVALLVLSLGCERQNPPAVGDRAESPQRIVTLAPSITEIVFALGLEQRVVGVGSFADYPPAARDKPRLGGLVDPNLELVVALDPQLAILLPSEGDVARRLERLGVEILTVKSETIEDLEAAVVTIARRTGVEDVGEELRARLERGLAPRPVAEGRRVLLTLGRPLGRPAEVAVAGPGTFYDALLERLGAVNVFADAGISYPTVGLEEILRRDPDIIVELYSEPLGEAEADALAGDWAKIRGLSAPARGAVRQISGSHTMIPGPRLLELYEDLVRVLAEVPSEGHTQVPTTASNEALSEDGE